MALQGSPKKLAEDISKGYFYVTPPYLKNLTPGEFKELYNALKIVQRDVRAIVTTTLEETKEKQMRLVRLNQVITVMENFAKKYKIII
jgi:hypothetical protein